MSKFIHKKYYTSYEGEWHINLKTKTLKHICDVEFSGAGGLAKVCKYNEVVMCTACRMLVPKELNTYLFTIGGKIEEASPSLKVNLRSKNILDRPPECSVWVQW